MVKLVVGVAIWVGSLWSSTLLPQGFIPEGDESRSTLSIELPPGSRLADSQAITDKMVARIRQMPEVVSVFTLGGATVKGAGEVRNAIMLIRYVPKSTAAMTGTLTAYAWDGSVSSDGGSASITQLGSGGASAFSAATIIATSSLNTAPTLTTTAVSLPAVNENITSPSVTGAALLAPRLRELRGESAMSAQ